MLVSTILGGSENLDIRILLLLSVGLKLCMGFSLGKQFFRKMFNMKRAFFIGG